MWRPWIWFNFWHLMTYLVCSLLEKRNPLDLNRVELYNLCFDGFEIDREEFRCFWGKEKVWKEIFKIIVKDFKIWLKEVIEPWKGGKFWKMGIVTVIVEFVGNQFVFSWFIFIMNNLWRRMIIKERMILSCSRESKTEVGKKEKSTIQSMTVNLKSVKQLCKE